MIVARVNIIWPEWCGRGRTRHRTVITGNLWNVPPTQVGVQSLIASLPVASAWAPQCDQFSFISTSAPSAQASTCWDGLTLAWPTQSTRTGWAAAGAVPAGWVAAAGAGTLQAKTREGCPALSPRQASGTGQEKAPGTDGVPGAFAAPGISGPAGRGGWRGSCRR